MSPTIQYTTGPCLCIGGDGSIDSILDEAPEQDYLDKNPARKLEVPRTRKPSRRSLSIDEIAELIAHVSGRDRLIVRMFLVLGLRPGELFALRRNDRLGQNSLRIDESVSPGTGIVEPKTAASNACVWVPPSIASVLDFWMESLDDQRPEASIFPSRQGTPLSPNNFLKRNLQRVAEATISELKQVGAPVPDGFLTRINFQALRRTCATHMQHVGTVKDVQAHLRHARPTATAEVYMQDIPESVRAAVTALDQKLTSNVSAWHPTTSDAGVAPN